MKLLLTGVTGVAGLAVYRAALVDPAVSHITVLSRRPIPPWAVLPPNATAKTTTIIHDDFLSYSPDLAKQLAQNDACVWALGRSVAGMSEKEYTEMTHGYLLNAANALKDAGVGEGRKEGDPFRFVFISGENADPTETSVQMWARVKGRAETDLTELCASTPGMKARIFRPAYFFPPKKYPEDRKNQRPAWFRALDIVMTPVVKTLLPSIYTPTEDLGKFAIELAKGRWPEKVLFRNVEMRELVKEL
ncbi:uncharacterized protein B0H18DRAFT_1005511 [Fomitopsis serialis]|uniref:uncharacterized protein n=1 Tax=Fomitopsis serialis TaxID=139415 RepID=UPI0020077B4B|nr:uncharacterized protein B0H18DRAFT_1005511 [Neoantrodia serialis]KAH9926775.1 hypothetical protein B0H18DRAFT_1005511 [Neoantrodia serialis]